MSAKKIHQCPSCSRRDITSADFLFPKTCQCGEQMRILKTCFELSGTELNFVEPLIRELTIRKTY